MEVKREWVCDRKTEDAILSFTCESPSCPITRLLPLSTKTNDTGRKSVRLSESLGKIQVTKEIYNSMGHR